MNQTQSNLGFKMPAEWGPHSAVWLAWPYDKISFGSLNQKDNRVNPERLKKVEDIFLQIVKALEKSERVNLLVRNKKNHSQILKNLRMIEADYADVWTRDYMPIFVKDEKGKLTAVKWDYNAYGEKFAGLIKDNNVWNGINQSLKIRTIESRMLLESGSIEVNGSGVLLTTEQCLFKRNPQLTREDYEEAFVRYLGVSKTIWLKEGLVNDHTDGHVDEIARFVASNKIICAYEENTTDENYKILDDNYHALKNVTDIHGKPFEIVKLPMPHMIYDNDSKAPASYCNFYIGNKVVLASIFNDPNDQKALEIIQSCFLDRKVIPIDCSEIIYGGGAVHCMTQQQPLV